MPQRLTLTDIADQAGVSTATVSRVLNGKSNVADSTRRQVLAALDILGYERPSRAPDLPWSSWADRARAEQPDLSAVRPADRTAPGTLRAHSPAVYPDPRRYQRGRVHRMLVDRGVAGIIFVSGRHADTTGDVTR